MAEDAVSPCMIAFPKGYSAGACSGKWSQAQKPELRSLS